MYGPIVVTSDVDQRTTRRVSKAVSKVYGEMFGFFFQAEDGIRDLVRSRGLGDVYKRQVLPC
mgnify:CR=1 FL=1